MNVLLTGAAGFVGWKTAQLLLEQGYDVVSVDNLNDYYDLRLKRHRLDQLEQLPRFKFYHADIENLSSLDSIFGRHRFDAIINLAARAGVRYSLENPHIYLSTNTGGTLNLLELMRKYGVRKFVLASTSSLYAGQPTPFSEDLPVNTPLSPYAASKKGAELMAYSYHHLFGIDVTVLRYFTVYGPAGRPDMATFRFIQWIQTGKAIQLYGDGSQARDFTYVDDIAIGTIQALKAVGYEIINLGGGNTPVTVSYAIGKMEEYLGKKAKIDYREPHPADMHETWADISKAKRLLGWQPEVPVEEGLRRTVAWHMENQEWVREIAL